MTISVENYGIHWDNGTAWLIQGRSGTNFTGMKGSPPFRVEGGMCNHLVPTAAPIPDRIHWEKFLELYGDPLVQAMLPTPRLRGENLFYIEDPHGDLELYIATLTRMSSPIMPVSESIDEISMKSLQAQITSTNIQPLVITHLKQSSKAVVDALTLASEQMPRTVLMTGRMNVVENPPMKVIETRIRDWPLSSLLTLPFENIGAAVIRRYARKEELGAPMESRQDRRERQIRERSKK